MKNDLVASPHFFCPLPWDGLSIRNDGAYRVCCQANVSEQKGVLVDKKNLPLKINANSINEARNSLTLKNIRSEFLKGKWPNECVRCQNEEACGAESRRSRELKKTNLSFEAIEKKTDTGGGIHLQDFPVRHIDLRLGNLCNLACRMCGPEDSSKWIAESQEVKRHFGSVEKEGQFDADYSGRWSSDRFWNDLFSCSDSVEELYLAGGEPLLVRRHEDFLRYCIDRNISKKIEVEYNTNLTYLPDHLFELWPHFKKVKLGISMDGLRSIYEYQRYPAKWDHFLENLTKLRAEKLVNLICWVSVTITNYNILQLPEIVDWAFDNRLHLSVHFAHRPLHLNIQSLSPHLREKSLQKFDGFCSADEQISSVLKTKMRAIKEMVHQFLLQADLHGSKWGYFCDYTRFLDRGRGQRFEESLDPMLVSEILKHFESQKLDSLKELKSLLQS